MVTYDEYLGNIFRQILESYNILKQLKDKPGDLDIIQKELLKINGYFQVIASKIGKEKYRSDALSELKPKVKNYLESYYFEREIEIMGPLYSEDPDRLRNIRLKIIDALNDRKLIDKIDDVLEEL